MFYEDFITANKDWIDQTFNKIDRKLSRAALRSRDKLPYTENREGVHDDHKNNVQLWTNGFWGRLYGDFFFTEAILKLKGAKFLPW